MGSKGYDSCLGSGNLALWHIWWSRAADGWLSKIDGTQTHVTDLMRKLQETISSARISFPSSVHLHPFHAQISAFKPAIFPWHITLGPNPPQTPIPTPSPQNAVSDTSSPHTFLQLRGTPTRLIASTLFEFRTLPPACRYTSRLESSTSNVMDFFAPMSMRDRTGVKVALSRKCKCAPTGEMVVLGGSGHDVRFPGAQLGWGPGGTSSMASFRAIRDENCTPVIWARKPCLWMFSPR